MTTTADVYTQPDTVTLLHAELGSIRAWRDFLADCIRNRTDFHGLQLLPVAYLKARCGRPVYDMHQVLAFINEARLRCPGPIPVKPTTQRVRIESPAPGATPRQRRAFLTTPGATSC